MEGYDHEVSSWNKEVDILHPLATLHWEECCDLPETVASAQCAVLHGRLFVGGGINSSSHHDKLFVSSEDLSEWSTIPTPTEQYALTTYRSQLVLVGGREVVQVTNKLYNLSVESVDFEWQSSLPPMPTARFSASAVSTQCPELLVVAGGLVGENYQMVDIVEVLKGEQWGTVQPLPVKCYGMNCALHKDKLYLVGGETQNDGPEATTGYQCNVKSLLDSSKNTWDPFHVPLPNCAVASFGQQLLVIGGTDKKGVSSGLWSRAIQPVHTIFALCRSGSVLVGSLPSEFSRARSAVLPTGELVVLGEEGFGRHIIKASLKMSQYGADQVFNHPALFKLEKLGIKVVSTLVKAQKKKRMPSYRPAPTELQMVVWQLALWGCYGPSQPWWSLFKALEKGGHRHLVEKIEERLGERTLKDLCMSVIISALLGHGFLLREEVLEGLPDYVPTVVKKRIVRVFREHT